MNPLTCLLKLKTESWSRPRLFALLCLLLLVGGLALKSERVRPSYAQRFDQEFPPRAQPRQLSNLITAEVYDKHFWEAPPAKISNDEGDLAWRISYRMSSLNEMYRATRDAKYLQLNTAWSEAVMRARDDMTGQARWDGQVGPVWSSVAFSPKGRTAYLVHTAVITFPMLDLLCLKGVKNEQDRRLLEQLTESLDAHDYQWRVGPGEGEGHYVYTAEQDSKLAGTPLPINRNNAMAKSLWLAWKLTGRIEYCERALALAKFFKNRLEITETGAYTWPYDMALERQTPARPPEDSSHGALTASLVPLLATDGQVFTSTDLDRFAATVLHGVIAVEDGVIGGDIAGTEKANPVWVDLPARWLEFSPYHRAIYPKLSRFYAKYDANKTHDTASLALALFIRHRPIEDTE